MNPVVECPRCGRRGRLVLYRVGERPYMEVRHGRRGRCHLGPADLRLIERAVKMLEAAALLFGREAVKKAVEAWLKTR